jgi:hypothetical protein
MRFGPIAVVVLVLVLAVAGCGGGKKKSAAATTAAATATTSAASTGAAAPSFASTKNCQQLSALGAKMSKALQASAGNGLSSLGDEANIFKTLASVAPAEIRGDFETFAAAFSGYAKALGNAGIKPGKTATAAQIAALTAAAKSFSTPKLQAAEQHLAAWGQKNCGIGSTTTG